MLRYISLFFLIALTPATLQSQPSTEGKIWLLAVGIGTYQHSSWMSTLHFTVPGAYDFVRLFEQRQLVSMDGPLVGPKAKKSDILAAMRSTFVDNPDIRPEDMIIFYFSGHGEIAGGKEGICPYDYNPSDIRGLIRNEEIQQIMSQSPARHKVCFIEACKTEVQTQRILDPSYLKSFNQARRKIGGGLVFITSTEAGMPSLGDPNGIGGYFTHFLLKGLEGQANTNGDAYITVDEIFTFVEREVSNYTNGAQAPQINDMGGYDGKLPIVILPEKLPRQQPVEKLETPGAPPSSSRPSGNSGSATLGGKTYRTLRINGLNWMAQNLDFEVADSWCYGKKRANCQEYGRLYTWAAAKKACAALGAGWRLPTDEEWGALREKYGGFNGAYQALIEGGNTGFAALLGGWRYSAGSFYNLGGYGHYWSATESGGSNAWYYNFHSNHGVLDRSSHDKALGFSCRCVQGAPSNGID